jgi:membrane associated rhomboid family serine protease
METTLLLLQFTFKPVALFCCALFAGASTYISLVEHPTIVHGGTELVGSYLLFAKPRPAIFQTSFAAIGALAGIAAGMVGAGWWWVLGGLLMGFSTLFYVFAVLPQTRRLLDVDLNRERAIALGSIKKLVALHATQTLSSLAALFVYILKI